MMHQASVILVAILSLVVGCTDERSPRVRSASSNVLIILADDLGYSDLGAFGGEIETPHLDALATRGVRLTGLHSAPSCSPSRAMLMSGSDPHVAGLGAMVEAIPPVYRGRPGFEGVLSDRVASLAERFEAAGYQTMMAGKWHLGQDDGQRPAQRGFQQSFALLQGAANHFGDGGFGSPENPHTRADYIANDLPAILDADFYSSDAFASSLIESLESAEDDRPFFAYLSFTAPHSPLQAPKEDIERYRGRYDEGWAQLARRRIERMREAGVLPGNPSATIDGHGAASESWDRLAPAQRKIESRKMEIYAAMVDRLDQNVGLVLASLERTGRLENTLIVFLSDNGPAGETAERFSMMPGVAEKNSRADHRLEAMGSRQSFVFYGPHWASAAAAPSRLFKGSLTEGGTLVPAILAHPSLPPGTTNAASSDLRDIAPTLLAFAGIPVEDTLSGRPVAPLEGRNLMPLLRAGTHELPDRMAALEFYGQSMVRHDPWKLLRQPVPVGTGDWQLFDVFSDPGERLDRSSDEPALVEAMEAEWARYSDRHGLAP
jgi:arylsulfatase